MLALPPTPCSPPWMGVGGNVEHRPSPPSPLRNPYTHCPSPPRPPRQLCMRLCGSSGWGADMPDIDPSLIHVGL
jgi:hypothetical protein